MATDYQKMENEFEEKVVRVSRVSKKTKGGNKIGFSVLVVVGDRKGKVGVALGKATDVSGAIRKGFRKARKSMVAVPIKNGTIPHQILIKFGAAKVLLKPAPPGTGMITGGPVRVVAEAAGIKDLVSKILGTRNKASNVYATIEALRQLQESSLLEKRKKTK
ncbi:30S ribosomal protein S5 [Patescibacteria group bacterium]